MDGIFSGSSTDEIEKLFAHLIMYDVAMPHTQHRLSPITFSEFLVRNNILCINQYQVYDAANRFWQRYVALTPGLLEKCQQFGDMNICEQEHAGWNKLIDYLNRILDVQAFNKNPYYQMHYLAHVGYLFNVESFKDTYEQASMKVIFNEVLQPIVYPSVVRTTNTNWTPVKNFADVTFGESIVTLCGRVSGFIEAHSSQTMNYQQFDVSRLQSLKDIVTEGLEGIHSNKYNGDSWKSALSSCLSKVAFLKTDMELCELHESFERDGMKCCPVFRAVDKVKKHYEKQLLNDDPDEAIDELLDAYALLSKGLESYNISTKKEEVKQT